MAESISQNTFESLPNMMIECVIAWAVTDDDLGLTEWSYEPDETVWDPQPSAFDKDHKLFTPLKGHNQVMAMAKRKFPGDNCFSTELD